MGFIDKVKGFFYDEEEVEEEVEVPIKRETTKKKNVNIEKKEEKEISERELFKAERTFNFPMDMEDDEELDFTPIRRSIKEEKIENKVNEEPAIPYSENTKIQTSYRPYMQDKKEKKEEKKFKPTPIISPIYGVIEGEIKKEDEKDPMLSETREFSITKRVDFDAVREKAYGKKNVLEEEDENKGIFFNLVDDENKENIKEEEKDDDDDIKITYNDVDYDDEDDEDDIEIPKITRIKKNKSIEKDNLDEDSILSETKEQDLFNLIDNMYNSEEEGDE